MDDIILRYYEDDEEEFTALRRLWDDIFADPPAFADYYFKNVCTNNKILMAMYKEELVGMVHLNPYLISMNKNAETCYYIVGVGVREDMRNQGIMKLMLKQVMADMLADNCPFAFLMPENKDYYSGLGFETIYQTKVLRYGNLCGLPEKMKTSAYQFRLLKDNRIDKLEALSTKINELLGKKYQAYAVRDLRYLINMWQECRCQNGDVCIVCQKGNRASADFNNATVLGLFSYGISDGCMYVERFEHFLGDVNIVLRRIKELAWKCGCKSAVVTIPVSIYDEYKESICSNEERAALDVTISDGKGIMAVSLNKDAKTLKNVSFFDEIV